MFDSKSKSSGLNEISSQYRAPVETPKRANTFGGPSGSTLYTRSNWPGVATTIPPDGGCFSLIPFTGLSERYPWSQAICISADRQVRTLITTGRCGR